MFTGSAKFLQEIACFALSIVFVVGQREVDIAVYGNLVAQTDVSTYTVYNTGKSFFLTTLTVFCTSFVRGNTSLKILRDGITLNDTDLLSNPTNTIDFTEDYNRTNVLSAKGKYTCRLQSTYQTNNRSFSHCVESEILINTTINETFCASNIGFHGYVGEHITVTCVGELNSVQFLRGGSFVSPNSLHTTLIDNNTNFHCVNSRSQSFICEPRFIVQQSLNVEISPTNFTRQLENVTFKCISTPQRFLHWEIFGNDGNILDFHNLDHLHGVQMNVTINQTVGLTFLTISALAESKIKKIVCSTYDTRIHAEASATLIPGLDDDRSLQWNISERLHSTSKTTTSQTTSDTDQGNGESSTDAKISSTYVKEHTGTAREESNDVTQLNPSTLCLNNSVNENEIENNFLTEIVTASASFVAIFVLGLTGLLCLLMYRTRRKTDPSKLKSTREIKDNILSPETEMTENVVYEPYQ